MAMPSVEVTDRLEPGSRIGKKHHTDRKVFCLSSFLRYYLSQTAEPCDTGGGLGTLRAHWHPDPHTSHRRFNAASQARRRLALAKVIAYG